ncbi:hypothetical protein [Bradyrhizobium canariense]|uniref:Uncharacterized protein n=1 Tax=Bradyrhizobium canariense TaxID=255045 RepID=A0A1X3H926_9BRAD|nr:hypothetical protein [Bradyrhizobium canariense]OSI68890.1 hypothetical protein BSZ22_19895 [Bradyrhizobium canariense]OSI79398.1 hypothetical protein BSZ23_15045 [Bradyrhizobium canariense]OSI89604.1 hypothetical protein BSZ25_20355 [Bradyrhizobium canariense]OSI91018.1 hypothetical protein BSZ24_18850 [Bradyrhizobium canariense]OSJ03970.1 hypothetical protein BSZ16_14790 [Bradyrhizobium canariense]
MRNAVTTARQRGRASAKNGQNVAPAAPSEHNGIPQVERLKLEPPPKSPGTSRRGSKLTRAGLLLRYQAFLVGELETLSWYLYGDRNYALNLRINDQAVNVRCASGYVNGEYRHHARRKACPFFDKRKLPSRARAVLASLSIDVINAGDLP